MMRKKWWVVIYGETEGPYTMRALKKHPDITFDTLAQRRGESEWRKIGEIPELKKIFAKRRKHPPKKRGREYKKGKDGALVLNFASNHPVFWGLIAFVVLLYLVYWWLIR